MPKKSPLYFTPVLILGKFREAFCSDCKLKAMIVGKLSCRYIYIADNIHATRELSIYSCHLGIISSFKIPKKISKIYNGILYILPNFYEFYIQY